MSESRLLDDIRNLIQTNPTIAAGAEPGEMRMTRRGVWIEFYYPAVIEGDYQVVSLDVFDLMRDSEVAHESKTR